ncbi:putative reverse transcriptase domain-containing protein [Tanacetum coccineum]|uniref:Reverse transcriptase domain-containing protein n=1 Tax=Tanacetum coccineum TaxID=301880 RepID=A0ABQ5I8Q2_9ASTR
MSPVVMTANSALPYTFCSHQYVPEDHVPVYILEPEHPEDLVPAEDEAPTPPLPPFFLAPRIRPPHTRAAMRQMRATNTIRLSFTTFPSKPHHYYLYPLPAPSYYPSRADFPRPDTPPRKRLLLTTLRPECEVGESSATAAARQPGPTIKTRLRDTERRMMTALRFESRCEVLRREDLLTSKEYGDPSGPWLGPEAHKQYPGLELEHQAIHIGGYRPTRLNPGTTPPPVTDTHTATSVTSAQLQAMIDEGVTAVLAARATTRNGDDSHTSGTGTNEVAYAMTWSDLKKKMTTKYCPRNEIKKIEAELWNLKVKGTDVVAYNQRFQELALLSDRMFPEETDKIERYVGGMPDLIYSSVVASKPKTMQEAIEMATELMDRRNNTFAERQAENKRKFEDTPRNNQNHQPNKRQNTGRAYAAGNGDKKSYEGTKPLCPKCNFNHYGPCIPTCTNCKKLGHLAKDCRSRSATANNNNNRNNNNNNNRNNNNPRAQGENTNAIICFECGAPGLFRKNCPQWKNKNQGNGNGVARAYAVGVAGQNPNNNVVTGTFLLNNRCASILFDTGADRSFVSTQFSTLINITPTTLDHGYNVELADGRII